MPLVDPVTMSTAITKGSSAQASSSKGVTPVIALLDNPAALAVSIAHPLVLGALFVWRFGSLVTDPVEELQLALPVVAFVQVVFAAVCLPPAGSQGGRAVKKARPGEKKRSDAAGPNPIVVNIIPQFKCYMDGI